ncbi:g7571 [Coccomyxa viridis]|uniref:indole-3-glycerol-phosphate synthase n=1 Tax=Coccomyxa viridis TaxID=1274662 RepID=A0ABP1FY65_9CHLO
MQQHHRATQPACRAAEVASRPAESNPDAEVFIRRRAPEGLPDQPCGAMQFVVPQSEDNKPRNILEEIVWWKAVEIARMKERLPLARLMMQLKAAQPARDFIGALRGAQARIGKPGLIAEVKKASPSRGVIQPNFDPVRIAQAYEAGGAACLSVLTDAKYFQGSFEYLQQIRAAGVGTPLLCKEFIVEAYQLFKARASGADAVLLIAAVLPNADLAYLVKASAKCSLQVLVEVHSVAELERVLKLELDPERVMLGINNRDLQTFEVDLQNNQRIMDSSAGKEVQKRGFLMAGESGIFTPEHVAFVQQTGCGAILVGESLVKEGDPEQAVKKLLSIA